jgi:tetratricopeptide (TPR) repeat protein/flagellar hook assembly protein FlgD
MSQYIKGQILIAFFTSLLVVSNVGQTAPLLYPEPLSEKYHRLEVVVPYGFQANCTSKPKIAVCKISIYSPELLRVFQIGAKTGMEVQANQRSKEITFTFNDPKLVFQHKVLEGPPRWAIEIGYEEVLIQPIENELPFRPYPMPVQTVKLPRPGIALDALIGEGPEVEAFNRCWTLRKEAIETSNTSKWVEAYKECKKIDTTKDINRPTARSATRLMAEIIYAYLQQNTSSSQQARQYVGSKVLIQGDRIELKQGTPVKIGYSIQSDTPSATLSIRDANGTRVYQAQIDSGEIGKVQQVTWEGRDLNDSELPAGNYSFTVSAAAAPNQEAPSTQTYVQATVEGLRVDPDGFPRFVIGKRQVRMGEVILPGQDTTTASKEQKYFFTDETTSAREVAIEQLKKAEKAAASEREKARYVLLTTELIGRKSMNEATEYLRDAQNRYRQTKAEPFILAERARLLLDINANDEAAKVLDEIAKLDSKTGYVMGSRILALASLAYARRDYTSAIGLYDEARESFPELLLGEPGPLFQVAELYFRARRLEEALPFYQEFLDRFKDQVPHWIAKIRLAQIKSFERPLEAFNEMSTLSEELTEPEGQQLAKLYMLTLSSNDIRGPSPDKILRGVSNASPTEYVLEELLMQKARNAMRDNDLHKAFVYSQKIVKRMPDSSLLRDSSLFFQRILLLEVDRLLREGKNIDLVLLYLKEKSRRFREPSRRGLLHLYVARAMRDLKMLDEAATNVIAKGGLPGVRDPKITALLNLELTGIFREKIQDMQLGEKTAREDINKFKQAVESIVKRFPDQFDTYDYWASRGYYHELENELRKAKKIYLYALNGPNILPHERIKLARSIYEVYMKMPDYDKALHALKILLEIYDEFKDDLNMPGLRLNVLWNRVELQIQKEDWPDVVSSIKEYLEESQSTLSSIGSTPSKPNLQGGSISYLSNDAEELTRRHEALFYKGYALLKLGLIRQAQREWDLLNKKAYPSIYSELAGLELRMLSWRDLVSTEILKMIE